MMNSRLAEVSARITNPPEGYWGSSAHDRDVEWLLHLATIASNAERQILENQLEIMNALRLIVPFNASERLAKRQDDTQSLLDGKTPLGACPTQSLRGTIHP